MVLSPSFATDCLETLEEVGIGLKEDFEEDSKDRTLIVEPCLNDDEQFSLFVSDKIKKHQIDITLRKATCSHN